MANPHHVISSAHRNHKHTVASHQPATTGFITQAISPAQDSERVTGVPASVTMAQAILESGWGKHHMGGANNYFGVKAQSRHGQIQIGDVATGYVTKKTGEHLKGKNVTVDANFRSYKDMNGSFIDHGKFLVQNPRYSHAIANYQKTHDADGFARDIQKAGYATDPDYASKLIKMMKGHNLYQYNLPAK